MRHQQKAFHGGSTTVAALRILHRRRGKLLTGPWRGGTDTFRRSPAASRDYIRPAQANGTSSLHHRRDRPATGGGSMQIPTTEMHQVAEYGIAPTGNKQGRRIHRPPARRTPNASTGLVQLVDGRQTAAQWKTAASNFARSRKTSSIEEVLCVSRQGRLWWGCGTGSTAV